MRKWVALALAVMMMFSVTAYAVPSKTTGDVAAVEEYAATSGAEIATTFSVEIVEESAPAEAALNEVYTLVTEEQKAPIEFFVEKTPAVATAVAEKLPTNVAAETLEINEFVPVKVFEYKPEYGTVEITFAFETVYEPDQFVVALLGVSDGTLDADGNYVFEWIVLDAAVQADGTVKIAFTQEAMEAMQAASYSALAILNEPFAA